LELVASEIYSVLYPLLNMLTVESGLSVLDEYLVLGTVPEVDGLGEDGVVLGLEEVFEEVADDGSLARAEVLAFGGLIGMAGTGAGAGVGFLAVVLVAGVGALETVCC
jgi:hypothetical protein